MRIESMDLKQFGTGFATGTITIGILAGGVFYDSGSDTIAAASGESVQLHGTSAELQSKLTSALERIKHLETRPVRVVLSGDPTDSGREPGMGEETQQPDTVEPTPFEALKVYPGFEGMIAALDWAAVGSISVELRDVLLRRLEVLARGEELSVELVAQLREIDSRLVQHAGGIMKYDVPGLTPDSKVRHPIVMANWLNSVLNAQNTPLTPEQRRDIEGLGLRYSAEDDLRRSAYAENSLALQRRVDELDLRDRFMADARARLTPDQLEHVWQQRHSGRAGANLLSTDFAWEDAIRPVVVADRGALAHETLRQLAFDLRLDASHKPALERLVKAWAEDYPDAWWSRPMDSLDRGGVYETARLRDAAYRQMRLWREILRTVPLSAEQRQILQRNVRIRVPYRRR